MLPHTVMLDPNGKVVGTFSPEEIKAEKPVIERVKALSRKFMKATIKDMLEKVKKEDVR